MLYEMLLAERPGPNREIEVKTALASALLRLESNHLYKHLLQLPAHNYLTTNYDYCFERSNGISGEPKRTEEIYSLRRLRILRTSHGNAKLWHIHGEAEAPKSMMLGLDHYCGSLARLDAYVKGNYKSSKTELPPIESMRERLAKNAFSDVSWVDLFFSSNVHIIGLALEYSEMDIWWLLNRRYRLLNEGLVRNKITFHETSNDPSRAALLRRFGVDVTQHVVRNHDYESAYLQALNAIG